MEVIAEEWPQSTRLLRDEAPLWRSRLSEACTRGVWDESVSRQLAERYVAGDLEVAMRGVREGPDLIARAARALWIMAVQVCREDFPEGEIDEGPPGL